CRRKRLRRQPARLYFYGSLLQCYRIPLPGEARIMDDNLQEGAVRDQLTTIWLGRPYHYVESIDSTNDRLKVWASDPAYPSGAVLLTDFQSAGRGRLDRRWEAPPGSSLLFSVLLRP